MDAKHHPNRLGAWGWVGGGRWGYERYLYLLHRISGVALLFYFLLHLFVTATRIWGPGAWEMSMERVRGPGFVVGEYLVFLAFAFHAVNGVRLGMLELGFGVGRPLEPVYPYATSVGRQRPLALAVMLLAGGLAVWGGLDFFVL